MPLFSIVFVHYQGVNSHETFLRGYRSIAAQAFAAKCGYRTVGPVLGEHF